MKTERLRLYGNFAEASLYNQSKIAVILRDSSLREILALEGFWSGSLASKDSGIESPLILANGKGTSSLVPPTLLSSLRFSA
jgi:hypothetical protein